MKKLVLLFSTIALSSCFMPITEETVAAVEDDRNPMIVIDSPEDGSVYMSKVIIKGRVKDDSQESGDNKGYLRFLSVSASAERNHRGKISIDSDGSYNSDSSFGSISGSNFTYNAKDKSFKVTIDTADFRSQSMSISIEAVDRNGNESSKILRLQRSTGPYLELTSETDYTSHTIVIEGRLANSSTQRKKHDELKSIRLRISQLSIDSTLNIEDTEPVSGVIKKDLPRSQGKPGTYMSYNVSNPDELKFEFKLILWESDHSETSLNLSIIAEDKNGITSNINEVLNKVDSSGPTIKVDLVEERSYYFSGLKSKFYSPASSGYEKISSSTLQISGVVTAQKEYEIADLKLKFQNSRVNEREIDLIAGTTPVNSKNIDYTLRVGNDQFIRSGDGDTTISLVAKDNASPIREDEKAWLIKEDSTPPTFSDLSITTSTSSRYVGVNSTVNLSFKIQDAITGVDFSTLSMTIAGTRLSSSDFTYNSSSGVCTVTGFSLTNAQTVQVMGDLLISISVSDKIGNSKTIDQDRFDFASDDSNSEVQFLRGNPTLSTIRIASTNQNSGFAQIGDEVILTAVSNHPLDHNGFTATIAGITATVDQTSPATTLSARVSIPESYANSPIPFEITAFRNAAGTSGVGPIIATTDSSSVVLYTTGPTLTIRSITSPRYIRKGGSFSFTVVSNQVLDTTAIPTVTINPTNTLTKAFSSDANSFTVNVSSFAGTVDSRISVESISGVRNVLGVDQINTISSEQLNAWYYPREPSLSSIAISLEKASGNTNPQAEANDKVVLTFSVTNERVLESDPTVSLTLSSRNLTAIKDSSVAAPRYRYTYTIVDSDIGPTAASVAYTISGIRDMAGNERTDSYSGRSSFKLGPPP